MTQELTTRDPEWVAPAVPLPVRSQDEYVEVAQQLKAVKEFERRVTEWFAPLKTKAHAAWKALVEREGETLAPAREWESRCKAAMAAWDTQQEELRRAEERRLQEEARKREEERRLAEAAALEAEGIAEGDTAKVAEAESIIEEPVETPVVVVPKATPKVQGISYREQWLAQVVDLHALIRYVAQNPAFTNLLLPNMAALNAQARSLKANLAIPGVKAFSKKTVAAR